MKSLETLLKEGTGILAEAGIEEAGLDAWLLLEYATGKNRAYYYAHKEELVSKDICAVYSELCKKRSEHIPLQHLTHQAFFMEYEFYVDENVLIPRQDTEILTEEALNILKDRNTPNVLDMCTGSGCILLSILAQREDATGTGVDISEKALEIARKNAKRLGVEKRTILVKSDTFLDKYFQPEKDKTVPEYDIIVSNPPYIPTAEIEELMDEVRLHDPRTALDGKEDGLYFYRILTEQSGRYLKRGGWLLFEIGCTQGISVSALMKQAGFSNIQIKKDLSGLDRVVLGQKQ